MTLRYTLKNITKMDYLLQTYLNRLPFKDFFVNNINTQHFLGFNLCTGTSNTRIQYCFPVDRMLLCTYCVVVSCLMNGRSSSVKSSFLFVGKSIMTPNILSLRSAKAIEFRATK